MFFDLTAPVIFAHRGASAYAPENTLSAFILALEQGAKAIELDVQLTADQEVVAFHDSTLDRTTNTSGKLSDYKLSQLKELNAGFRNGDIFRDEKIPTLGEIFAELHDASLLNIELKNLTSPHDDLPQKVAEVIDQYNMSEKVLVSSFNPIALKSFARIKPDIPLGRLIHTSLTFELIKYRLSKRNLFASIHLAYKTLTYKQIKFLHSNNVLVFTYTLNDPDDILRSIDLGVDGFFTDDPALAIRTLTSAGIVSNS
jgi:glycerophosphoryl diester phosphodiesterase